MTAALEGGEWSVARPGLGKLDTVEKVKSSRYRPGVAQRVGRGTALLFHDRGTRRCEWSAARPGLGKLDTVEKVKCSRYRPGVAHRVGTGIALIFHDRGIRRGGVVISTPRLGKLDTVGLTKLEHKGSSDFRHSCMLQTYRS